MAETYEEYLERLKKANPRPKGEDVRDLKVKNIKDKDKKKRKPKNITYTSEKEFDFLKYYIVIENYYLRVVFKDDLQPSELKMLFFLYSEPPFTRKDFHEYTELLFWNKKRLDLWIRKGYIEEANAKGRRNAKLYKLSKSTMRQIRGFYDKLVMRYKIPDCKQHNPMFRPNTRSYTDKRYAKRISIINKDYEEFQNNSTMYNKVDEDIHSCREPKIDEFIKNYEKGINKDISIPSPKALNKKSPTNQGWGFKTKT